MCYYFKFFADELPVDAKGETSAEKTFTHSVFIVKKKENQFHFS
jgi:hypothetical protein